MEIHLVRFDQSEERRVGHASRHGDAVRNNVVWLEKILAADPDCPSPLRDTTVVINAILANPVESEWAIACGSWRRNRSCLGTAEPDP